MDTETKDKIEQLTVKINRKTIQGGLTNEEFDEHDLIDWRLQHNFPTNYVKIWKGYEKVGDDSKFTDIRSKEDPTLKAEGKKMTGGVTLSPSRDTGAGRSFNEDNLNQCFEMNNHYFLYDRGNIDEITIEFIIYWISIDIIKKWYEESGNRKGVISFKKLKNHIDKSEIVATCMDRSS
jgi:hypothetical protein